MTIRHSRTNNDFKSYKMSKTPPQGSPASATKVSQLSQVFSKQSDNGKNQNASFLKKSTDASPTQIKKSEPSKPPVKITEPNVVPVVKQEQNVDLPKKSKLKAKPRPSFFGSPEGVENMIEMKELTEQTILDNLESRFKANLTYVTCTPKNETNANLDTHWHDSGVYQSL